MDLNVGWFILLGLLLAGYAVLDGFDLGAGILHLIARTDRDRRLFMNAIGPIWDVGNAHPAEHHTNKERERDGEKTDIETRDTADDDCKNQSDDREDWQGHQETATVSPLPPGSPSKRVQELAASHKSGSPEH